jgi:hypothetical protein
MAVKIWCDFGETKKSSNQPKKSDIALGCDDNDS